MYNSITPLEIRQKDFEKGFRGYEKEQVDAFLKSLSQEWERVIGDYKNLEEKLQQSERDVYKLREVENSLFKALKTAEDTGASMIEQADKSASLQLKEAKMVADNIVSEAKNHSRKLIEEAEGAVRDINSELRDQIKQCENDFRSIEDKRDNLLIELRGLANDTLERVAKHQEKGAKLNVTDMLETINKQEQATDELSEKLQEKLKDTPSISKHNIENLPAEGAGVYEFEVNTKFEIDSDSSTEPLIKKMELNMDEVKEHNEETRKEDDNKKSFFDDL